MREDADRLPVVAHFIGSLQVGGAENQVVILLDQLDRAGFGTHVITLNEVENGFREMVPAATRYYCIKYRKRTALPALARLYRYLQRNTIDILHCHMYHAAVKGAPLGKLAGIPVIITSEHGQNSWQTGYNYLLERYMVNPFVAKRVAVSDDIRELRIKNSYVSPDKICVISNSVNTDCELANTRSAPSLFGALGRLVEEKDYPVMFRALKIVRDKGYDVRLSVAGAGGRKAELEREIDELNMRGIIELVGVQNAEAFLSSIDVFLMSSKNEGVPVSLLEAMAHGLPIVSTGVGGIPEVVEHRKEALLCESGKPSSLADNMIEMIENEALRASLSSNGRKRVVENYGAGSIVGKWSKLYVDLWGHVKASE